MQALGMRHAPLTVLPYHFHQMTVPAAEHDEMTAVRLAFEHLLDDDGQARELVPPGDLRNQAARRQRLRDQPRLGVPRPSPSTLTPRTSARTWHAP